MYDARWALVSTHNFFKYPSTLVFGNGVGTRVQRVGYNNDHRVLMCDTVFVSSGAVHCFVLAVKLMLQSGVQQGGEIAGVAIHTFTYLVPKV